MTSDMRALTATLRDLGIAESVGRGLLADRASCPGVTVVTLSYRHSDYFTRLADTLPFFGDVFRDAILVWNGGDQATAEAAEQRGWTVLVGDNRSFAGGCNDAVARAYTSHVLLLSDDAEVQPDTLARLWARREHPLVAPVILDRAGRVNSAGGVFEVGTIPVHRAQGEALDRLDRSDVRCPWATGAALLIARELWDALGGFDEGYAGFGGYQDTDLCLRAGERGVPVLVAGDAIVIHEDHGTRDGTGDAPNRARFEREWVATGRLRRVLERAA